MCASTPAARVVLPADLSSGRLARRFLEARWCTTHDSAQRAQAHLLLTELVSNAVRHGGPPIEVELNCVEEAGVLLSVSDGSPHPPVVQEMGPSGWGGRGVCLVDVISAEWGVEHHHADAGHHHHDHHHDHQVGADQRNRWQRYRHEVRRGAERSSYQGGIGWEGGSGLEDRREGEPHHGGQVVSAKTVWCRLVG
ncbi:anti-sigma regulatory factor (Ser/Thr protein kinase) [Kineococcus radiotolerans]|uniref:Anti-sigma regulatory factor (Ser/Thr protein kinase) n=1 Tax=Kineococcus radiotolerans TaxID=131568 RepID=A0A7W4TQH7_KINRA|nr:ATP-binding protein [Kineococcus radiotolerans]MBB2903174.1 anti-sigma regulatory factor (Ser/Thr protein kinase) [Kineococcus radiotolerans]